MSLTLTVATFVFCFLCVMAFFTIEALLKEVDEEDYAEAGVSVVLMLLYGMILWLIITAVRDAWVLGVL